MHLIDNDLIEWIVIDGGSAPESAAQREMLEVSQVKAHKYISEQDDGIYDAMNKGTSIATGDYVLYLNAGDELHQDFDLTEASELCDSTKPSMLWGDSWDKDHEGNVYKRKPRSQFWLRYGMAVCHQAVLFKRVELENPAYDTSFKIAADYDLVCRIYKKGLRVIRSNIPMCTYDLVGESSNHKELTLNEESIVRIKHFGFPRWTERILMTGKRILWNFSVRFPEFRSYWRRWV